VPPVPVTAGSDAGAETPAKELSGGRPSSAEGVQSRPPESPLDAKTVEPFSSTDATAAFKEGTDRALPAKIVERLVHLIATVSPGAKKGSTAPYAYADLMLIEAGARQPRSLAAAFRDSVIAGHGQSLAQTAIKAAIAQLDLFDKAYDRHEARRVMNATGSDASALGEGLSLNALATWAAQAVRAGTA